MDKSGAWFSYQATKIGQGKENAKIYLRDNPQIANEIANKIKAQIGETNIMMSSAEESENAEEGEE